jgi:renalase
MESSVDVLIVGAGISGLVAAKHLRHAGFRVTVVDKSRGVGGRMATRRIDEAVFDHGAQYFTVRSPSFQKEVAEPLSNGTVINWSDGFTVGGLGIPRELREPRYCGAKGMTSLPKAIAQSLDVQLQTKILHLRETDRGWTAVAEDGKTFEARSIILATPVPQALALLPEAMKSANFWRDLEAVEYEPCFALMVRTEKSLDIPDPGGCFLRSGIVHWIADNQRKGISPVNCLTVLATPIFSRDAFEHAPETVAAAMLGEIRMAFRHPTWATEPGAWQLHRWRYAQPHRQVPERCALAPTKSPLLFVGDAFGGGRVEGAASSGEAGAQVLSEIIRALSHPAVRQGEK